MKSAQKPSGRKKVMVAVTVIVEVEVTIGAEADDDGCGGPGKSGNCMTGFRGWFPVVEEVRVVNRDQAIEAIEAEAVDDPMVQKAADDWEPDDPEEDDDGN